MQGTTTVPFSDLFADTVQAHGVAWARKHYTQRGMSDWEFRFWCQSTLGVSQAQAIAY